MGKTIKRLKQDGISISHYNIKEQRTAEGSTLKVTMEVKIKRSQYEEKVTRFLNELDGVCIENIE